MPAPPLLYLLALAAPTAAIPTSSASETLTLPAYVRHYRRSSPELARRKLDVGLDAIEVDRRTHRALRTLRISPAVGARAYHVTNPSRFDPLGSIGADAEYSYTDDDGTGYAVRAGASWPTRANLPAGNPRYGVEAAYRLPLLRNFGGRENAFGRDAAIAARAATEAVLQDARLASCADATERYVVRYAAHQQLAAYDKLLVEKRRVWRQTIRDFDNQMVKRIDLLAARSDWLAAQSLRETFAQNDAAAALALAAYVDLDLPEELAEPRWEPIQTASIALDHPRLRIVDARIEEIEKTALLEFERGKSSLDLEVVAGASRTHDLFIPPNGISDFTDLYTTIGVEYLWPIERPESNYQQRTAKIRRQQLVEERRSLLRDLHVAADTRMEEWRHHTAAHALLEQQLSIMRGQIVAARRELRDGKREFQSYLDHWERYQRAHLDLWDRWAAARVAKARLTPILGTLPEHCREETD